MITDNVQLGGTLPAVTLAFDYDYNGKYTTMAANIGGGTANFDSHTGKFTGFSDGTDDFINAYTYDMQGNLTSVVQTNQPASPTNTPKASNDVAPKTVTFSYDLDSRMTNANRYATDNSGALNSSTRVASAAYTYNGDSELTDLTYSTVINQTATTLAGYHYTYNDAGLVKTFYSHNDTSGSPSPTNYTTWAYAGYSYDPTGQLLGASYSSNFASAPTTDNGLSYDFNGNRATNSSASFSNRLLYDGTSHYYYTYDDDGNRLAKYQNTHDKSLDSYATDITTYTWNDANQLTASAHFDNWTDYQAGTHAQADEWAVTYAVDAYGRMVSRSYADNSGSTTAYYIYDGANQALVFNASGQVTERELYGPAVDQILASEVVPTSGTSTVNWMLTDGQGSVRDVAQVQNGVTTLVDHVIYTAFGQASQSGSCTSRFGFDGMRLDPTTGCYVTEHRFYDPNSGNWLSQDPIGFNGGDANLQRYCGNSPTNFTDPAGLDGDSGTSLGSTSGASVSKGVVYICINGQLIRMSYVPPDGMSQSDWDACVSSLAQGFGKNHQLSREALASVGAVDGQPLTKAQWERAMQYDFDNAVQGMRGRCNNTRTQAIQDSGSQSGQQGAVGVRGFSSGGAGVPVEGTTTRGGLPLIGKPNTSDSYDKPGGGGQIRDRGPDGRPTKDFDFGHDHGAGDPHVHDWDWANWDPSTPPHTARQPGRQIQANERTDVGNRSLIATELTILGGIILYYWWVPALL